MRFSWTGLILAPLLVPMIFCASIVTLSENNNPLVPSCVVSYGTTIFLFLPALYLLSLWRPMTGLTVCLLGLVLGMAVFVPLTLMEWKSSGPDSGPPTENFFAFFVRWAANPLTLNPDLSAGGARYIGALLGAGDTAPSSRVAVMQVRLRAYNGLKSTSRHV
jgi:hypothetical protein